MTYKNYTVVGSPTITDDGVASGFSASNIITTPTVQAPTTKYELLVNMDIPTSISANNAIIDGRHTGIQSTLFYFVLNYSGGQPFYQFALGTSSTADITGWKNLGSVDLGKNVTFKFTWNGTEYRTYKSVNGGDFVEVGSAITSSVALLSMAYTIGSFANGSSPFTGQIDLKQFPIEVDGNLVYQPYNSDFKLINRIYTRHDTASNFSTNNPVLGAGELAIATDTHTLKAGDGTTAYNSLPEYVKTTGDQTISGEKLFTDLNFKNDIKMYEPGYSYPASVIGRWNYGSGDVRFLIGDPNFYKLYLTGSETRPKYGRPEGAGMNYTDLALYSDLPAMTDYYTKTEVDTELAAKQDELTPGTGIDIGYTPNYTVVGNPTITDGVLSNVNGSNYLITDFTPNGQPWEIKAKVTTGSSLGNLKFITGNSGSDSNISGPAWGIDGDKWACYLSSNGHSYDIASGTKGSYYPLTNTTYYLKMGWTGSVYYLDYSTDDETYTRDISITNSNSMADGTMLIGLSIPGSTYSWNGSIDLNEFKFNDVGLYDTTDLKVSFDPTTIPGYSASGTYTLKLVNGVVQWVAG